MKLDKNQLDELFIDDPDVEEQPPYGTQIKLNQNELVATVFDWLGSLFFALVVVLLVMTFCFRIIDVEGTSMEPTLINSDKVVITDLFYTPENGDIVIISHADGYNKPLVKRVIATAGQTVRIADNAVYVDGERLEEDYIQGVTESGNLPEEGVTVPDGKVFVLGDNRSVSLDSRYDQIGFIDEDCIIGKAQLDVIPHTYDDNSILKTDFSRIRYIYKK